MSAVRTTPVNTENTMGADPLAVRSLPEYDPSLPALDKLGVVALCQAKGVTLVGERAVVHATRDGSLPSYKVLGRLLWAEVEVLAWLRGMRRVAGGDAA